MQSVMEMLPLKGGDGVLCIVVTAMPRHLLDMHLVDTFVIFKRLTLL